MVTPSPTSASLSPSGPAVVGTTGRVSDWSPPSAGGAVVVGAGSPGVVSSGAFKPPSSSAAALITTGSEPLRFAMAAADPPANTPKTAAEATIRFRMRRWAPLARIPAVSGPAVVPTGCESEASRSMRSSP